MKTTFHYAALVTGLFLGSPLLWAQNGTVPQAPTNVAIAQGVGVSEPYYGYGHVASTAEAGVIEGWGGLARSVGEANYFRSLARINAQESFSRYVQNAERGTEAYFRVKQVGQAARDAQRPQRLSYEQHVVLAKKTAPDGLSEHQYDRTLGRLNWPAALADEEFAAERQALERTFMTRTPLDAGPTSAFYRNVRQLTESLDAKLKTRLDDLSPAEYIAARKFITGLAAESSQPLVLRAVASR